MDKLVLIFHALAGLVIILLVLLQQGKGAAMGASFGSGASQTVFGSEGSGNFFTRATWTVAALFFCTSFGLAIIAKNHAKIETQGLIIPAVQQEIPVSTSTSDVPAAVNRESDIPAAAEQAPATE